MITTKVNLEKELLKQNVKAISKEHALAVREFDRLGQEVSTSEVLSRIGINNAALQGFSVNKNMLKSKMDVAKFDQQRVFHVSQIEQLCNKYYLRFLPSCYYHGEVDKELPVKLQTFEIANGVKLNSTAYDKWTTTPNSSNTFICAPASSFKLQEKPKDPLLFYKINEDYYYLIHKWGNDLNVINRFKSLLSGFLPIFLMLVLLVALSSTYIGRSTQNRPMNLLFILSFTGLFFYSVVKWVFQDDFELVFFKKNEWNSPFKD
jgi:hypothetical protein